MIDSVVVDLKILHELNITVALVHGYIKRRAEEDGYDLAGKKFIKLTMPEIADGIGFGRMTAWRGVKILSDLGYIERIDIRGTHGASYAVIK